MCWCGLRVVGFANVRLEGLENVAAWERLGGPMSVAHAVASVVSMLFASVLVLSRTENFSGRTAERKKKKIVL